MFFLHSFNEMTHAVPVREQLRDLNLDEDRFIFRIVNCLTVGPLCSLPGIAVL